MSLTLDARSVAVHDAIYRYLEKTCPNIGLTSSEAAAYAYRPLTEGDRVLNTLVTVDGNDYPGMEHIWSFNTLLATMGMSAYELSEVLNNLAFSNKVFLQRDACQNIITVRALYYVWVHGRFIYSEFPGSGSVGRDD